MKTNKTESNTAVGVLPKLVQILSPLAPSERDKAISAAKILLAESAAAAGSAFYEPSQIEAAGGFAGGIGPKVANWLRKNHISRGELDQIFSIEDNTFDVIALSLRRS